MLTTEDLAALPASAWMPSRIPIQDALATFVPEGVEPPNPPRPVYEMRWFPEPGGARMLLPYDGGPFDEKTFRIEQGAWDHVTCDLCNARILPMTLCYVTREGAFNALCEQCFKKHFGESAA